MSRIIAVANQKGGVGKTTTVVNLGAGLARLGSRALLVDLDPQGSLTYSFGLQAHELSATVYQALTRPDEAVALLSVREKLWLLPANLELSAVEGGLAQTEGRELLLKKLLERIETFDYVLLDCPPAMGLLTMNGLVAAGELIVPLQAEYLPLQGLGRLQEVVEVVRQRLNPGLQISGVVITRFDKRKSLHRCFYAGPLSAEMPAFLF